MTHSISFGDACRKNRFILLGASKLVEGKRNRTDLLARIPHQSEKCARIHSCRKKGTYLNIGEEMRAHAIQDCCAYQVWCFRLRYRSPSAFSKNRRKARERPGFARSGTVHPLRVPRWQ